MNLLKTIHTNTAFANLYAENSFTSAVVSQSILWEKLLIQEENDSFYKVLCEDGYQGWIHKAQVTDNMTAETINFKIISQPLVRFFKEPDYQSPIIGSALAGNKMAVIDENKKWLKCTFPDNRIGWAELKTFLSLPQLSRKSLISYAEQFIGVPYFWGGKTPLGFDCSGFVQFIHKTFNINIRRDAYMQFDDSKFISDNYVDGRAGDLCFFSENSNKITHVGFYLGNNKVLHARGMVRINSLSENDADYDKSLLSDFVSVKSFIPDGASV